MPNDIKPHFCCCVARVNAIRGPVLDEANEAEAETLPKRNTGDFLGS